MDLHDYFTALIDRLQASDIGNNGKDAGGFFEPTRAMLLQRLSLLRDLHGKPAAKVMVRDAWAYVVEHAPPEWLIANAGQKAALKAMLA